jgi:2,4-dienoyl-CoA reductase (NADPH2)
MPLITTNRINTPEVAERMLASGEADMVSMARPFLADPEFVNKAADGRADEINTCIACNQACLDHTFKRQAHLLPGQPARLPRNRTQLRPGAPARRAAWRWSAPARPGWPSPHRRRARPSGDPVRCGAEIGGQFNIAKQIPGKEEFTRPCATSPTDRPAHRRHAAPGTRGRRERCWRRLRRGVLATGVTPRTPNIPASITPRC